MMLSALKLCNFSIKAGDFFKFSNAAWFWSSDIPLSVIKVCSTTSCIALKSLWSDCSSRHNFGMMVSTSSNNDSFNTVLLGFKRSDRYLLLSWLGLATSIWSGASKIFSYLLKHLLIPSSNLSSFASQENCSVRGVWNKEPIRGTCNWDACYEEKCGKFFFEDQIFLPTLNLSHLSNKI